MSPTRRPTGATRVTIASRLFPPESGAAAFRLGALARALTDRGVWVDVVTTRPPNGLVASDPPGLHASRLMWRTSIVCTLWQGSMFAKEAATSRLRQ